MIMLRHVVVRVRCIQFVMMSLDDCGASTSHGNSECLVIKQRTTKSSARDFPYLTQQVCKVDMLFGESVVSRLKERQGRRTDEKLGAPSPQRPPRRDLTHHRRPD